MTNDQLKGIFTYHAPFGDQAKRYELLRAAGLVLAAAIQENVPESAEKTLAIRRVQEAVMYANAAIACNERQTPEPIGVCARCCIEIRNGQLYTSDGGVKRHVLECCPAVSPQKP